MNNVLLLNKQTGETPLACIERFRINHPEYQGVKMTYAGRLDPIASGLLIILTGDKVHDKEKFLGLSKTYECTALLGVTTDTYDVLGIPVEAGAPLAKGSWREALIVAITYVVRATEEYEEVLQSFLGTFQQSYPPYSSKTVDGKQLHQIARAGNIDSVNIPSRQVTVHEVGGITVRRISRSEIRRQITDTISQVSGDFRQLEIQDAWNKFFLNSENDFFVQVSFTISVSSGTYIRGIVNSFGEKLGIGSCIMTLRRTVIGDYSLDQVEKV